MGQKLDKRIEEWVSNVNGDPYADYNHVEFELIELDHVIMRMDVRPESKNPYGIVHGSAMYLLADEATGSAIHTDGRAYVTQTGTLHFLSNQKEGVVRADAQVVHRGKSTALIEVTITGENDKVLAVGDFSFFCLGDNLLAEIEPPNTAKT